MLLAAIKAELENKNLRREHHEEITPVVRGV
jgi:hypothetical protein